MARKGKSTESVLLGALRSASGHTETVKPPEGKVEGAPAPDGEQKPVVLKALSRWDPEVLSRPWVMKRLKEIGPTGKAFKCLICGKFLVAEDSQEFGSGHRCDEVVTKMTPAQWEAHYADMAVTACPEGWVRLNTVYFTAKKYGRSAGEFLKRCGGDRGDGEGKVLQVAYLTTANGKRGARFVPGECLTAEFLKSLPTTKKAYKVEEMPEDERKFVVEVEGM